MRVAEIMTRPVIGIGPAAPIREAVRLLIEHGFAGLPVVDDESRVIGILTEADALASSLDEAGIDRSVDTAMSTPAEVATPDTEASVLARRMLDGKLRCVPIVQHGELVGVVSRRDLLRPLVRRDEATVAAVLAVLTDYTGHRNRWQVHSLGGTVTLAGPFADEAERRVLVALVKTVPGVARVELADHVGV